MIRIAPMKKVTKVYDHLLPNNKRKANIYAGQKNENALCKIVYSSKKGSNYSVKIGTLGRDSFPIWVDKFELISKLI